MSFFDLLFDLVGLQQVLLDPDSGLVYLLVCSLHLQLDLPVHVNDFFQTLLDLQILLLVLFKFLLVLEIDSLLIFVSLD